MHKDIYNIQKWMVTLGCYDGKPMLKESVRQFLTEADSRLKKVEAIITQAFSGLLDVNGPVSGEDYYVNGNPNTRWKDYLVYNLRHTFGLMANSDVKYLPAVANIAYNECDFDKQNQDLAKIDKLKKYIQLAKKEGLAIEFGTTFNDLAQRYDVTLQQMQQEENDLADSQEIVENRDYQIINIPDFDTAEKYGQFTGVNGNGQLCYTQEESTWDNFTKGGTNECYLCLRNDFQEVAPEKTEGYPKDSYGLSMIWLFVDGDGEISNSNVRWNHGDHTFGNVDNMFTKSEIQSIVGVRFNETFKPNNRWNEVLQNALERLRNGEPVEDVFDKVGSFKEGFAKVRLNGKLNFINKKGNLLAKQWFDYVDFFREGFAKVKLNDKCNFINTEGNFLCKQWFDVTGSFDEGFAAVNLNGKWNFINTEGNLLCKQWFDLVDDFCDGFARVILNGECNFIGTNGEIISNQWFDAVYSFYEGFAKVKLNGKLNFINKKGNLLSNQWFDYVCYFRDGFAAVRLNGKYNFIKQDGQYLSNQWFDWVDYFSDGFAAVKLNGKYNFIDTNGNIVNNNLNESRIYRIIKECVKNVLIPESKTLELIKPNKQIPNIMYHVSNPYFRENILKQGLKPMVGDSYKCHYEGKRELLPVVFLKDTNDYDSTYDDDRWIVDVTKLDKSCIFKDFDNYMSNNGCFVYTKTIPVDAIKLIHKGSGE